MNPMRMLIVNLSEKSSEILYRQARLQAALLTDEKWEVQVISSFGGEEQEEKKPMDIVYLNVVTPGGVRCAETIRRVHRNVYMVLVVSEKLSPVSYLKPTVMAASVLALPFSETAARDSIREAIRFTALQNPEISGSFIIRGREETIRLAFVGILYFEAREKKIYAVTETEEYGFYDSMEQLLKKLPRFFMRCHRGFVVNTRYLKKLQVNGNGCVLGENIEIPVSRSYKKEVKAYFG